MTCHLVNNARLAAAAKSLQSSPTLCDPIDGSPPGSAVPGILQARTLEWVAISFSNAWKWKVKVKSLSHVWLLATPWTAAHQAPPSMGFSRQEYWSGLPLPSPNARPTCGQNYEPRFFFVFSVFLIFSPPFSYLGFPGGSIGKGTAWMQEIGVQALGQEDAWRRKWQSTPVLLPGESHAQRTWWATVMRSLRVRHDWAQSRLGPFCHEPGRTVSVSIRALQRSRANTPTGTRSAQSLQSCPTVCDRMDYSPPGSSVHGWDAPGKNTGVCCHALLQGIFPTQGSNLCLFRLLHWQVGPWPQAPPEESYYRNWLKLLRRPRSPTTYFSVSWRPGVTHSDSKGLSPGALMSKGGRRWTSQLKWIQGKELAELLNTCVHTRARSCLTATPWTAACQALLSTGFPR